MPSHSYWKERFLSHSPSINSRTFTLSISVLVLSSSYCIHSDCLSIYLSPNNSKLQKMLRRSIHASGRSSLLFKRQRGARTARVEVERLIEIKLNIRFDMNMGVILHKQSQTAGQCLRKAITER
jgi:hypothetical protein